MASLERLIIQNLNRSKLMESFDDHCSNVDYYNGDGGSLSREAEDLIDVYSRMLEKGFRDFPEATAEKRAFRQIENRLLELKVPGIRKTSVNNKNTLVGEYLTSQEDTIKP